VKSLKVAMLARGVENLGVESLSAVLKRDGHQVRLFFDPADSLHATGFQGVLDAGRRLAARLSGRPAPTSDEGLLAPLLAWEPDVVGFSAKSMDFPWAVDLADRLRPRTKALLMAGGPHATVAPERVMAEPSLDACMVGEADDALPDACARLASGDGLGGTGNLWHRDAPPGAGSDAPVLRNPPRPYVRDLDALPFPDKALFYDQVPFMARNYQAMVGRGCPWACTFCANNAFRCLYDFETGHVRTRGVDSVVEELVQARRRWPVRQAWFCDDVFAGDVRWLRRFVPEWRRRVGLPFVANVMATQMTEERARLLAEAGCREVFMGVECAVEDIRRRVLGRPVTDARILEAARHVKAAGIRLTVDHIVNIPFTTPADEAAAVRLYAEMQPDNIFCYWLTYTPGTAIVQSGLEDGRISPEDLPRILSGELAGKGTPRVTGPRDQFFVQARNAMPLVALLPRFLGRRLGDVRLMSRLPRSPERFYTVLTTLNGILKSEQVVRYYIGYVAARKGGAGGRSAGGAP
jgi:anaerobic magnesium-protoporphyrin IX monomethyl ester cyclase